MAVLDPVVRALAASLRLGIPPWGDRERGGTKGYNMAPTRARTRSLLCVTHVDSAEGGSRALYPGPSLDVANTDHSTGGSKAPVESSLPPGLLDVNDSPGL